MPLDANNLWAMLNLNPQDPAGLYPAGTFLPAPNVPYTDQYSPAGQVLPPPALQGAPLPAQPPTAQKPVQSAPAQDDFALQHFKQLMEERLGGIKGMQKQLDQIQNSPTFGSLNLRPLMGYADQIGQTNMSQSYQTPPSQQEQVAKLKDAIANQQGKAASDFMNLMNAQERQKQDQAQAQYYSDLADLKSQALGQKADATAAKGQDKAWQQLNEKFMPGRGADPGARQAAKDLEIGNKARSALTDILNGRLGNTGGSVDPQTLQLIAGELSKLSTSGVGTEHEIKGLQPGTFSQAWTRFTNKFGTAPRDVDVRGFLQRQLNVLDSLERGAQDTLYEHHRNVYNTWRNELPDDKLEQFQKEHPQFWNRYQAESGSPKVAAGGSSGVLSPEEWLKQHRGSKQ